MRKHADFDPNSAEAGRSAEYIDRLYPALFESAGLDAERMDLSFELTRDQDGHRLRCSSKPHPDHDDTRFDVTHLIHRGYGGEEHMWHAEETAAAYAWMDRRRRVLRELGVTEDRMPLWALQVQIFVRKALDLGMTTEEDMQRITRSWRNYSDRDAMAVPRSPAPDRIQVASLTLGHGAVIKTSDKGVVTVEVPDVDLPESLINGLAGRPVSDVLGHPALTDPRILVKAVSRRKKVLVVRIEAPFDAPAPPEGASDEQKRTLMQPWADRGYLVDRQVGDRIRRTRR